MQRHHLLRFLNPKVKSKSKACAITQQVGELSQNNSLFFFFFPSPFASASASYGVIFRPPTHLHSILLACLLVSSVFVLLQGISYLYYACSACYIPAPALLACSHDPDRPFSLPFPYLSS
ncbi:hypothetical protein BDW75DRAFT_17229 [Aspergillus navahoensis]